MRDRPFHTRADLTTCGRNILPAPNRSPTTFMLSISGPSITWIGRPSAFYPEARLLGVLDDSLRCRAPRALSRFPPGRGAIRVSARFCVPAQRAGEPIMRSVAAWAGVGTPGAPVSPHFRALAKPGFEIDTPDHARIDDAHCHSGLNRVQAKIPRPLRAPDHCRGTRSYVDTPPLTLARVVIAYPARRLDKIHRVVGVFDAGRDRENVDRK